RLYDISSFYIALIPPQPLSKLFPYTTLFRSREYRKHQEILERVRKTLKFLANDLPNEHGFFYHFIHMDTGQRWEKCELSSIDTSDRKSTRLNSSHVAISYAVFCLKKKTATKS